MTEDERALLRRLAVFVNGCTVEAAEYVGAGEDQDVLDLLTRLANKSLVVVEEQDGAARYRLLETIRQYARARLSDSGEATTVRDHHLTFFNQFAHEAKPRRHGPEVLQWFRRLETEHDNLRAALEWGLEQNPVRALELALTIHEFWSRRGYATEGRVWMERALEGTMMGPLEPGESEEARRVTQVLSILGMVRLATAEGHYQLARSKAEEGIALSRQTGRDDMMGYALGLYAVVAALSGDLEASEPAAETSIALLRRGGASTGLAVSLATRALISAHVPAQFENARAFLTESTRLNHDAGMLWEESVSRTNVGQAALLLQDYDAARKWFRECLELFTESGDVHSANVARSGLAETERAAGNGPVAARLYRECILSWRELGSRGGIARCLECLGFIVGGSGAVERAAHLLGAAERLRETSGTPMTSEERIEYDLAIAALRSREGENRWLTAWQAGRALSLDEVVLYAQDLLGK